VGVVEPSAIAVPAAPGQGWCGRAAMSILGAGGPLPAEGLGAAAIAVSWERARCTAAVAADMPQASSPQFSFTPQLSKVIKVLEVLRIFFQFLQLPRSEG